jgi:predicted ATP-binding protein involved in virulence
MFLKKIHLQNFKCLADIEISFEKTSTQNRQWTLILGENGTGKSNVLKAIALVTSGSNALGELLGDTDSWIRNDQNKCRIDATLGTKKGEIREISLVINRKDNYSNIISNNRESLYLIDEAIEHADRNYFIVAYGASRRLPSENFPNFEKSSNGNRSGNVRSLFNNSYSLNPLTSWIIDLDYRSGEQGIAIVKDALDDFLPSASFHSIDKSKKQVLFKTIDGIVPLDYLSDGYQNMAAWIGDLLYRITETFRDYQNPLTARGVLLIDEIDLHLHPKWQRKLIDFITRKLPNFQVIATTHSPLTAQQADEGELYALKRDDENQIRLIPFIGTPKNLLINQLLMTPVFGLETDESLEIEQSKTIYTELKNKEVKSDEESKKLRSIEKKLRNNLPKREMPKISEKSLDLLSRIEANLNIQ